ncbi:GPI-anchored surface protein, putative [Bodo saltans]|uniref:GPI-anchored surface protein, putative n=1 Tax=Bodo saltans TaxID=75058 RepID=A0A0S4JSF0_BODSA|nr:GPI-anchored surface protein, putative [Bodo saltans]|eukprot:CUG94448.1 GPI-anchored surface protein, putative [Bodo saltans]
MCVTHNSFVLALFVMCYGVHSAAHHTRDISTIRNTWSFSPSSDPYWGIQVLAPPPAQGNASSTSSTVFMIVGSSSTGAGNLTSLNATDGTTMWTVTLDSLRCATGYLGSIKLYAFGAQRDNNNKVVLDCTVNCNNCGIIAVHANNGSSAWRISATGTSELFNGVTGTNDHGECILYTQYLTSSNNGVVEIAAIRVSDGTFVWRKHVPRWPEQTFLSSNQVLVFCPTQVAMFALNATDGSDLWNRTFPHSNIWMFGHTLLYSNANGGLCAVDVATNRTIWNQTTTVAWYASSAFATPDENVVVVVGGSTHAAGMNLLTGDSTFFFALNGSTNFFTQSVVNNRYLIWVESIGGMTVVDVLSGQKLWTTSYPCNFDLYTCHPPRNFAAVVGSAVFLSLPDSQGSGGNVTAFDSSTGEKLSGPTPFVSTPGTPNVVALNNVAAFYIGNALTAFS